MTSYQQSVICLVCQLAALPQTTLTYSQGTRTPPPDLVRLSDDIAPKYFSKGYYAWYFELLFDAVLNELEVTGESRFPTRVDFPGRGVHIFSTTTGKHEIGFMTMCSTR